MTSTLSKVLPATSRAAMVFSNVGAAAESAMEAISARLRFIASSKAGLMSSTFTCENGGTPPYGPFHSGKRGLGASAVAGFASAEGAGGAGGWDAAGAEVVTFARVAGAQAAVKNAAAPIQ